MYAPQATLALTEHERARSGKVLEEELPELREEYRHTDN